MITKVQQNLEDFFYAEIKTGTVGEKMIAKYPQRPIEDLAHMLTEGMMAALPGIYAKILDSKTPGYAKICEDAFYTATLRLLREVKETKP